jgi:hypothetical protein
VSQPEPRRGGLVRLLEFAVVIAALARRQAAPRRPRGVDPEDVAAGYEHSDMSPVVVGMAAVGLLITLALVLVGVTLFEQAVVGIPFTVGVPEDLIKGLQSAAAPAPPAPALEAESGQTFAPYQRIEQQKLSSYGWVDRSAGVIRMPIDRAMDLTAQRGLPSRPAPPSNVRDNGASSPSVASSGRVNESYP